MQRKHKKRKRIITLLCLAGLLGMTITLSLGFYHEAEAPCKNNSSTGWSVDTPKLPLITLQPVAPPTEVTLINEPTDSDDPVEWEANVVGQGETWGEQMARLDREIHNWVAEQAINQAIRRRLVAAVNRWLDHRHSPCAGTGELWVQAQERTGVSAALMIGIFDKESTSGTNGALSRKNHNGWGQMGPKLINWYGPYTITSNGTGWCWWPSWEASIPGSFDFVRQHWGVAQVANDCRGYCQGHPASWVNQVEHVRGQVIGWAR